VRNYSDHEQGMMREKRWKSWTWTINFWSTDHQRMHGCDSEL